MSLYNTHDFQEYKSQEYFLIFVLIHSIPFVPRLVSPAKITKSALSKHNSEIPNSWCKSLIIWIFIDGDYVIKLRVWVLEKTNLILIILKNQNQRLNKQIILNALFNKKYCSMIMNRGIHWTYFWKIIFLFAKIIFRCVI